MKRFFNILLIISILFAPIIQACPTCYGEKLVDQGYSKKQIHSEAFRNKLLAAMRNEDQTDEMIMQFNNPQQRAPVTQKSKFVSQGKQPSHHHRHKIGSSQRTIQYKNAGSL